MKRRSLFAFLKSFFKPTLPLQIEVQPEPNTSGLRRERRITTKEHCSLGWGCRMVRKGAVIKPDMTLADEDIIYPEYWQYFCEQCQGELTPGPSGGGTNQVCEKCRINYGCLDGGLQR